MIFQGDAAFVTFVADVDSKSPDGPRHRALRITDFYVKRNGGWIQAGSDTELHPESMQAQLEQLVLKAVHLLRGEADTANIAHKVSELTGKPITIRTVDESLVRLEGRQLVESRVAHPAQEPEGQLKRYSKITPAGERALGEPEATAGESIDALGDLT